MQLFTTTYLIYYTHLLTHIDTWHHPLLILSWANTLGEYWRVARRRFLKPPYHVLHKRSLWKSVVAYPECNILFLIQPEVVLIRQMVPLVHLKRQTNQTNSDAKRYHHQSFLKVNKLLILNILSAFTSLPLFICECRLEIIDKISI